MPLDVHVRPAEVSCEGLSPRTQLEDDGAFWYLHPFFSKVQAQTGERIDLYGDATFRDSSLGVLSRELENAERLLAAKPSTWTFRNTFTPGTALFEPDVASKTHVAAVIRRLRAIVDEAIEAGAAVEFVGD